MMKAYLVCSFPLIIWYGTHDAQTNSNKQLAMVSLFLSILFKSQLRSDDGPHLRDLALLLLLLAGDDAAGVVAHQPRGDLLQATVAVACNVLLLLVCGVAVCCVDPVENWLTDVRKCCIFEKRFLALHPHQTFHEDLTGCAH
jgi:hypothetical protein